MALVHLRLLKNSRLRIFVTILGMMVLEDLLQASSATPTASPEIDSASPTRESLPLPSAGSATVITGFPAVRASLMEFISKARKRVWLATDFLSDGEIATQLYLAQYRKMQVQVLVGRSRAQEPMSRLGFLKDQSIPVYLRPPEFRQPTSGLLADDEYIVVDGELDSRANYRKFTVSRPNATQRTAFEDMFSKAMAASIPALAKPLPLVGRAQFLGDRRPSQRSVNSGSSVPVPSSNMGDPSGGTQDAGGSFRYGYRERSAPPGIPRKLPHETILQQRDAATISPDKTRSPATTED